MSSQEIVPIFSDFQQFMKKSLWGVRTNTQVSDMRLLHIDTSARLLAEAAYDTQTFLMNCGN